MKKLIFILALFISIQSFSQENLSLAVGEKAKDFTLKTATNESVNLYSILKSNPVVLVVLRGWPGYQCPICSRQVGALISAAEGLAKHNVSVLMVYPGPSKDLTDHANEFKEDFKFPPNFHFTIDPDYSMINLYGLRWEAEKETAYPATIIIDKEGKIVYSLISHTHGGRSTTDGIIEVLNKL